jgi:hypothetical protein
MPKHRHIDGLEATRLAYAHADRELVRLPSEATDGQAPSGECALPVDKFAKKAPPRLRKPDKRHDRVVAPTPALQDHKAALRGVFGETLSDEFVDVMVTQLINMLAPGPFDVLEEATLNAAIAVIASIRPQSELEALLAVQIVAMGFAGLKFLRHSQHHLDELFIGIYGGYAHRLLRLQNELIQTLDKHRRGNKQTVEVRHVHIHPGGQGVVGIVNSGKAGKQGEDGEK